MIQFTKSETTGTHTINSLSLQNNQYIVSGEETEVIRVIVYNVISGIEKINDLDEFVDLTFEDILDCLGNDKKIGIRINLNNKTIKTTYTQETTKKEFSRRLKRNYDMFDDELHTYLDTTANEESHPLKTKISNFKLANPEIYADENQNFDDNIERDFL